jgi:hypothetical protein
MNKNKGGGMNKDLREGLKEVEKFKDILTTLPIPPLTKDPRTIAIKKGGKVDISRSSKGKHKYRKGTYKTKTAKYGGKVDNSGQHLVAKQYGGKVK